MQKELSGHSSHRDLLLIRILRSLYLKRKINRFEANILVCTEVRTRKYSSSYGVPNKAPKNLVHSECIDSISSVKMSRFSVYWKDNRRSYTGPFNFHSVRDLCIPAYGDHPNFKFL